MQPGLYDKPIKCAHYTHPPPPGRHPNDVSQKGVMYYYCNCVLTVLVESGVILANDTITGDPLLSVPLTIAPSTTTPQDPLLTTIPSLCYEVHGRSHAYFNLISDACTSVNAYYAAIGPFNVVHKIAVRAVDLAGDCREILVESETSCTASVNGVPLEVFSTEGVSVRQYPSRIRVSVPNCGGGRVLVMWVFCEEANLQVYGDDSDGTVYSGRMIRFVVSRGVNLQPTSHGIIGKFTAWQQAF